MRRLYTAVEHGCLTGFYDPFGLILAYLEQVAYKPAKPEVALPEIKRLGSLGQLDETSIAQTLTRAGARPQTPPQGQAHASAAAP